MSSLKKRIPNLLTFSRLVLTGIVWWLIVRESNFLAAGLMFLAAMTDVFDGALARRWEANTLFGRYFDHVVDAAFVSAVVMVAIRYLDFWAARIILVVSVIIAFVSVTIARKREKDWPNFWGKTSVCFLVGSACAALVGAKLSTPHVLTMANLALITAIALRALSLIDLFSDIFRG